MKRQICFGLVASVLVYLTVPGATRSIGASSEGEPIKIGIVGILSGEGANWGLPMKYSTELVAERINSEGGLSVGGKRHKILVYAEDDRADPKLARAAAEKLIHQQKIKYFIGPNTGSTCQGFKSAGEPAKVINAGYGFGMKDLWGPQHPYGILAMRAGYESSPFTYKYFMSKLQIKTISIITKNYEGGLRVQTGSVEAAEKLGLKVIDGKSTYEPSSVDFFPIMGKVVKDNPDVIDLCGATPYDAALATKAARQLDYKGQIVMSVNSDAKTFNEVAGPLGEGVYWIGNLAPGSGLTTPFMDKFVEAYKKKVGEWNDAAGGQIYVLEMIAATIQEAGPKAVTDTSAFLEAMPRVAWPNPYLKGNPKMRYIGKEIFGHNHQIGIPLVLIQLQKGVAVPVKVEAE
jgi:branched-chain amino acid transport system substrate-binding protein